MNRFGRPIRSLLGAALAYLVLGVPVARLWHDATATHRYCAEHRVLEEAGEADQPEAPGHSGRSTDLPADEGEHQTCPFAALPGSQGSLPGAAPTPTPPPARPQAVASPAAAPVHPHLRLLSVAPKTSPPRAPVA